MGQFITIKPTAGVGAACRKRNDILAVKRMLKLAPIVRAIISLNKHSGCGERFEESSESYLSFVLSFYNLVLFFSIA